MNALRSILAVTLGYIVFAVPAFAFFRVLGRDPHQTAPVWFMACGTACGVLFAVVGTYVAGRVAGRSLFAHAVALAVVIAIGAAASLVSTLGHSAIWSQVTALLFVAPSAALAGWLRSRSRALPRRSDEA